MSYRSRGGYLELTEDIRKELVPLIVGQERRCRSNAEKRRVRNREPPNWVRHGRALDAGLNLLPRDQETIVIHSGARHNRERR